MMATKKKPTSETHPGEPPQPQPDDDPKPEQLPSQPDEQPEPDEEPAPEPEPEPVSEHAATGVGKGGTPPGKGETPPGQAKKEDKKEPKEEAMVEERVTVQRAGVEIQTSPPPNDWNDIRAPIESTHNKTRDDREKQYTTDRVALEADYHSDLSDIQTAKQDALVAAGLNPDGSPPSDYGQTAPPTFNVGGS
jgi:hypothetical protein